MAAANARERAKARRKRSGSTDKEARAAALERLRKEGPQGKAWIYDPNDATFRVTQAEGFDDSHAGAFGMTYRMLRMMAGSSTVAPLRQLWVRAHSDAVVRQRSRYSIGRVIRMRDPDAKLTKAAKKRVEDLHRALDLATVAGHEGAGFDLFMAALSADSFTLDTGAFEILQDGLGRAVFGAGKPVSLSAVDAATIRRVHPKQESGGKLLYDDEIRYVQRFRAKYTAGWDADSFGMWIRNPRTNVLTYGYGTPELAELARIVSYLLNAETHEANHHRHGVQANQLLVVRSAMPGHQWDDLQRSLNILAKGPGNSFKLPMVQMDPSKNNESVERIQLDSKSDWQHTQMWFAWLMKGLCAMYGVDPAEIGHWYGQEGQSNSMNAADPTHRMVMSRERWLRPSLRRFASVLNDRFIYRIDPDFHFEIGGFDSLSEKERLDLDVKRMNFITLNELRAEYDLPPIDGPLGDAIASPQLIQVYMQTMGGGEGEGEPGAEGMAEGAQDGGEGEEGAEEGGPQSLAALFGADEGEGSPGEGEGEGEPAAKGARQLIDEATERLAKAATEAQRAGRLTFRRGAGRPGRRWALVPMGDASDPNTPLVGLGEG